MFGYYWHPHLGPHDLPPEARELSLALPWGETRDIYVPVYRRLVPPGHLVEFNGRYLIVTGKAEPK